ncbi:PAS domain-containing sensor histidine kinase [Halobaculum magnesiiphilum]|uniref:histidine kinase n=1 Tax=Halobaculum magnesiiphilum TaxID=1017351 RepID=A0A8T8W996_9EURY|nr:PAS domain S-box protein [Halobaculum magnesiiphilum]QZP36415.1 PAS domain S-box protein [Halobaculum magnesiiphilum]
MGDLSPGEALLDHAQDEIAVVTADGTFTYVNAAVEAILGYEPEDLVGENVFSYVHPDDAPRVRRKFDRTVRSDAYDETTVTYRHRTSDGSWVWFESRLSNLTADAYDGYVVSSRDITERVLAEETRDAAATRLHTIASVSGDVLWLFAGDWSEALFVNGAVEQIYGIAPERLYRDSVAFLDTVHPDDLAGVIDGMERLTDGESVDIEYRVNPDENFTRWVWVQATPIVEDGVVTRIAGFSRDVTDRRRREQHLVVMDNLLRHTLRNDLNVILGTAERIATAFPEAATLTEQIRATGTRLLQSAAKERQIIELLVNRRFGERIAVGDAVERAVERARTRHPNADIEYVAGPDDRSAAIPSPITAAVTELIENGIVHCDDRRPAVDVRVRSGGDGSVAIEIVDGAAPLPDVEVNVLTGSHEFGRDPVRHSGGLGVWLVYWCVELANGAVAVENAGSDGNRIEITVPTVADESTVNPGGPTADPNGSSASSNGAGPNGRANTGRADRTSE